MHYLTQHWSVDPFLFVVLVLAAWHEIGLARGAAPRLRSLWFYAGLVVVLIAVDSPIDYWSERYFFVHMLQHLLLMFAAPSLIVAGAPWQAFRDALGGRVRLPLGIFLRPWVSVALFNAVMIFWHLPGPYDTAVRSCVWLLHGSYLAAGILFWLQFIPSPPFRRRMPLLSQALALIVTNLVMIGLAMALSIFASHSLYSIYQNVPGVTLPPFADQQIGAAILWVCGDFWAVPAMIVIVRQLVETEGGVGVALDRILNRGATEPGWASRGTVTIAELTSQRSAPPDAGS
ncbi:MAG TPA: cytochrome c oxidase assembly protein [Streptosporangiaceae bacterium]|nr:cytochrome c oxidase assembly protein [Streptosporangiaceae bacterium]